MLGKFILASEPSFKISCIGIITIFATDAYATLISSYKNIIIHNSLNKSVRVQKYHFSLCSIFPFQSMHVLYRYREFRYKQHSLEYSYAAGILFPSLYRKQTAKPSFPENQTHRVTASTGGVITPRSSARIGSSPKCFFNELKSFSPGAFIHFPFCAVFSSTGNFPVCLKPSEVIYPDNINKFK